jgi:hypothetical protein
MEAGRESSKAKRARAAMVGYHHHHHLLLLLFPPCLFLGFVAIRCDLSAARSGFSDPRLLLVAAVVLLSEFGGGASQRVC